MPDALAKSLLLEDVVDPRAVGDALFASITRGVPLVVALTENGAVSPELLARYLARSDGPFLRQVVPLVEVVDRLPPGLCARLFAVPVRRDAITGTVDVVVADANDAHPGREIAFHLQAPVRLVRAPVAAIDEALRRLRTLGSRPPAMRAHRAAPDDERRYDSRPRADAPRLALHPDTVPPPPGSVTNPSLAFAPSSAVPAVGRAFGANLRAGSGPRLDDALRPSRVPEFAGAPRVTPGRAPSDAPPRRGRETPPWGTPVHGSGPASTESEPPKSGLGSEIPIPLTRRTFTAVAGGTQRPPPLVNPAASPLGEGIPLEPGGIRAALEVRSDEADARVPRSARNAMQHSFIPGPPPMPATGAFAAFAPQLPFGDIGGILAALRAAGSRDEVLELVLTAARMVAFKVALFVVKRGGYLGWACTTEFGDRGALQAVLVPLEMPSVFDTAVREGLYLGPIRNDEAHATLLHVMRAASRDVAVVPVRVSGRTAVIIVADELGDTMVATRRLEELARAAGEAFGRIVRMRR